MMNLQRKTLKMKKIINNLNYILFGDQASRITIAGIVLYYIFALLGLIY
jgi:hypothetical protein